MKTVKNHEIQIKKLQQKYGLFCPFNIKYSPVIGTLIKNILDTSQRTSFRLLAL